MAMKPSSKFGKMSAGKNKPSKSVYSDIAKEASGVSNRVMRGMTDSPTGMASAGIARAIGYGAKDVLTGKKLGRSAYEDAQKSSTARYRKQALMNKAKDESKATGQGAAIKRYKTTGNYGA